MKPLVFRVFLKTLLKKIKVFIPQLDEQRKISEMLSVIDERIATQNKIIEDSLIRGGGVTQNKPLL